MPKEQRQEMDIHIYGGVPCVMEDTTDVEKRILFRPLLSVIRENVRGAGQSKFLAWANSNEVKAKYPEQTEKHFEVFPQHKEAS